MRGPCEHCGNPMKEFWTTQCMYKGNWPSRRAFVLSTFDPPCSCDQYDEDMHNLARSGNRKMGLLILALLVVVAGCFWLTRAHGHDSGQWDATNPAIKDWYQSLMMPDNPNASCCGEADAYWADEIHVKGGKTYATVTDDRPDEPLRRPHIDIGTVVEIPDHKLKWDRSNPTGHGVVFLSRAGFVYCFVQPGGV